MSHNQLISVIMPTYNSELYVKDCIQSIVNQSLCNWELIIVDNCSTDGTVSIIEEFQLLHSKIKLYSTEFNSGGPAIPRNIGIKESLGGLLAFIDSDDVWHKEKLAIQSKYLSKYNLVCSRSDYVDSFSHMIKTTSKKSNTELTLCSVIRKNRIITSSVIVHKDLFLKIMFDSDPMLIGFEDYNAYIKYISLYGNGCLIGESLLSYRVTDSSLGLSISGKKRLLSSLYCLSKSSLTIDNYKCVVIGILVRLRSYFKHLTLYSK